MPELQRFDALIVTDFIAPELLAQLTSEMQPLVDVYRPGSTAEGFWTCSDGEPLPR